MRTVLAGLISILSCAQATSLLIPFVSDTTLGVGAVRSYDVNGKPLGGLGATASLSGPVQAIWGPDGNIYVTSIGSGQVLRYNGATGAFIDVFVDNITHDSS